MDLNCRAIDETRVSQEINELTLLLRINNKLNEALDLKKVLKPILPMMADQLEMLRATLTILNRSSGEIFIEEAYGLLPEERTKARYHPGKGIIGKIIDTGHPAIITGISDEPLSLDKTGSRKAFDKNDVAFIGVPTKIGKKIIGALVADRLFDEHIPFTEDVRLLTVIASSIAQAVHLRELAEKEQKRLFEENKRLKSELRVKYGPKTIIGDSKAMQNIRDYIDTVSNTNTTVLILGESGVGKERIAKAIHDRSKRRDQAFIMEVLRSSLRRIFDSQGTDWHSLAYPTASCRVCERCGIQSPQPHPHDGNWAKARQTFPII